LPDGDHTYTPHEKVDGKTYVLNEVVASNDQGSRSAWVLVKQKETMLTVNLVSTAGLPDGQVQLQAIVNGKEKSGQWSLPMNGPGCIDENTGLYTADEEAEDRFVLIVGLYVSDDLGNIEGHIILPLPLGEFEPELDRMKA
jgi:hypothetical protein